MTEKRIEELLSLWWEETNEEWTQDWRDELTADEQAIVEGWDYGFANGIAQMIEDSEERAWPHTKRKTAATNAQKKTAAPAMIPG